MLAHETEATTGDGASDPAVVSATVGPSVDGSVSLGTTSAYPFLLCPPNGWFCPRELSDPISPAISSSFLVRSCYAHKLLH